jgi:hypothetical protein
MKKFSKLFVAPLALAALLVACDNGNENGVDEGNGDTESSTEAADTTTGATQMVVEDAESLSKAVSKDGAWIVIFEGDLETDEELVFVDGFEDNHGEAARKLALYTQDEDRNIIDQFTLTAPSITVQNENTRIQGGTFAGDVYVEANGFSIPNGTIDGDLIFASEEFQETADLSEGEVTGEIRVEE